MTSLRRLQRQAAMLRADLRRRMVDAARGEANRLVEAFYPLARAGVRIVGLEPSCTLALRDEVPGC